MRSRTVRKCASGGRRPAAEYSERFEPVTVILPWVHPGGDAHTVRLLMVNHQGKPCRRQTFNLMVWQPALKRAGIESPTRADGTHALRHLFASVLLDAGESIKALSRYLGHSDPGSTLRVYTHLLPSSYERTRRAIDAFMAETDDDDIGTAG